VLFGATFDKAGMEALEAAPSEEARERNLEALARLAPGIAASIDRARLNSRVSYRATTPDRAPIAGLLPDAEAWRRRYAGLGRSERGAGPPPAHRGLYVLGGLGARGLTLAPLLGERSASELCGEPPPLTQASLEAIHPVRFLLRALKRA
jgi:tRNA 5-methylaminomethyl-2-thiouridine biosynthesis bifunctional protein